MGTCNTRAKLHVSGASCSNKHHLLDATFSPHSSTALGANMMFACAVACDFRSVYLHAVHLCMRVAARTESEQKECSSYFCSSFQHRGPLTASTVTSRFMALGWEREDLGSVCLPLNAITQDENHSQLLDFYLTNLRSQP